MFHNYFKLRFSFRQLWPVYLCWGMMMLATALAVVVQKDLKRAPHTDTAINGLLYGQVALATIIGGVAGRTWIAGWLLSVTLAIIGTLICCAVDSLVPSRIESNRIGLCSFYPLLMLCACAPMVAMRVLCGWSLTLSDNTSALNQAISKVDFFQLVLIVAGCISFAWWMEETHPDVTTWQECFFLGCFSSFSLLLFLPVTAITFTSRNWIQRLLGWFGMVVVAVLACSALDWVIVGTLLGGDKLSHIMAGVFSASLIVMLGLVSLLISGVKLKRFSRKEPDTSPNRKILDHEDILRFETQVANFHARALTGLFFVCTLVSVSMLKLTNNRALVFFRDVQSDGKLNADQESGVGIFDESIVALRLAPTATDLDLDRYRGSDTKIERLSLAGTKIGDPALEKLAFFPKLKHLDLSDTAITNAGIKSLSLPKPLKTLSVANTQIDFPIALDSAVRLGANGLDASGLKVTDDQLGSGLYFYGGTSLKLSHNPLSDAGVATLLQCRNQLGKLDISYTDIDGSGLVSSACPSSLNLDHTKITDSNLVAILALGNCKDLSIRETDITAAVLPVVAPLGISLTLGEGMITEQDLASLPSARFKRLSLNHKKFTCECLTTGKITFETLDLSNSGVTDEILEGLAKSRYIPYLNLSRTDITDKGLASLEKGDVIDLRHASITAAGILKSNRFRRVYIARNQFTPKELVSLRRANIEIVDDLVDSPWSQWSQ